MNIAASSANASFITFVVQNNNCPAVLSPGGSCSISFTTNTALAITYELMEISVSLNEVYYNFKTLDGLKKDPYTKEKFEPRDIQSGRKLVEKFDKLIKSIKDARSQTNEDVYSQEISSLQL